ncbi:ribonuclease P protein component [Glaciecola sp. XM2]|uniref:ribonuclease P protein component n=1 Tax=Glaciecola sp. XM2 TaxID=1914931 RepID=UPI001BDF3F25|nr:ribonuclease P protein component [Glaciecola sp. XM2]
MDNRFVRESRLLTPQQFSFVFSQAIPAVSSNITILARHNNISHPRLGITVAKKKVKLAVQRNRFKRCVRESFRLHAQDLPNVDIIVLAKQGVHQLDNAALHEQLRKLWKRLAKRCQ